MAHLGDISPEIQNTGAAPIVLLACELFEPNAQGHPTASPADVADLLAADYDNYHAAVTTAPVHAPQLKEMLRCAAEWRGDLKPRRGLLGFLMGKQRPAPADESAFMEAAHEVVVRWG